MQTIKPKTCGAACCPPLEESLTPDFFKALADPNRIAILARLGQCGCRASVSEVAAGLEVDLSVVSRHLAQLRDAGILTAEKKGKTVTYQLDSARVAEMLREMATAIETCCPPVRAESRSK